MNPQPPVIRRPPPPLQSFRQGNLYVSREVQAKLMQIAQARNELIGEDKPCSGCPGKENQLTADKIADEVLSQWLEANYPGLNEFDERHKALQKEALAFIKKFHEPNQ